MVKNISPTNINFPSEYREGNSKISIFSESCLLISKLVWNAIVLKLKMISIPVVRKNKYFFMEIFLSVDRSGNSSGAVNTLGHQSGHYYRLDKSRLITE